MLHCLLCANRKWKLFAQKGGEKEMDGKKDLMAVGPSRWEEGARLGNGRAPNAKT